jgi:hypothetical protein
MKSRRVGLSGIVAGIGEKRNVFRVLMGNTE